MGRLLGVSFAGVDCRTNIDRLVKIHENAPSKDFVEYGLLLSKHWYENGNRYFDPEKLDVFEDAGLNLCGHLCGGIAREAVVGNWEPFKELVGEHIYLFKRLQLNISEYKNNPGQLEIVPPDPVKEVIIQQKAAYDCKLFYEWHLRHPGNTSLSVLMDGSGGMGIDKDIIPLYGVRKVGYAGGINPGNVASKTSILLWDDRVLDFWIDMESGVRTDDWFDLGKVEAVIEALKKPMASVHSDIKADFSKFYPNFKC